MIIIECQDQLSNWWEGEFQNYYRDLSKRVKSKEVDLLIVVGMFLTGFDAPTMNTLFVDKIDVIMVWYRHSLEPIEF